MLKIVNSLKKKAMTGIEEIKTLLDDQGKIEIWPSKKEKKMKVLTFIASKFEQERKYTELEVNEILKSLHSFGDHVLLRRELYDKHFLNRTKDGRSYWLEA